jgi:hypothetical protein
VNIKCINIRIILWDKAYYPMPELVSSKPWELVWEKLRIPANASTNHTIFIIKDTVDYSINHL